MTPNPGDKPNYLPSSAHVFGIAVMNGAVGALPDKPRTIFLEAGFWTGAQLPILGLFRYYNNTKITFVRGEKYFIHSTIARFDREAVSNSQGSSLEIDDEFDIMGDVFQIVPVGEHVPAKYFATVSVTGRPSNIAPTALTFDIDVGQWVSFGKEKALFPFSGSVPQNGRWSENNRPFPNTSSPKYVSVIGFLTGTSSEGGNKRFTIEIHSLGFLGTAPQMLPKTLTSTPKGKRKAGLDFEGTPSKKTR